MWCNDGKHQLPFEHCSQTALGQDSLWVGDNFGNLGAADLIADFDATERQVDKADYTPTGGCLVLVSVSGRSSPVASIIKLRRRVYAVVQSHVGIYQSTETYKALYDGIKTTSSSL